MSNPTQIDRAALKVWRPEFAEWIRTHPQSHRFWQELDTPAGVRVITEHGAINVSEQALRLLASWRPPVRDPHLDGNNGYTRRARHEAKT